eukprot:715800-Karenia_brevis.AAC.1
MSPNADGQIVVNRLPSTMRIDETVSLCSTRFALQGIVFHHGDSPTSGHYVAVAKHGNSNEPFFVYNDDYRR